MTMSEDGWLFVLLLAALSVLVYVGWVHEWLEARRQARRRGR